MALLSPYGRAKEAGISDALLLDILLENRAADFGATQSLLTYPTIGILVDLLQHAVLFHLESDEPLPEIIAQSANCAAIKRAFVLSLPGKRLEVSCR